MYCDALSTYVCWKGGVQLDVKVNDIRGAQ